MEFKVVISDSGKTYQKEIKGEEAARLVGLRIGDVFDGGMIGEAGQLQVTGGTDKDGFPMRKGIPGARRVRILMKGGPAFIPKEDGERRKKQVRGDTISEYIVQVNTKIIQKGEKVVKEAKKVEAKKVEEEKVEEKPEAERPILLTKVPGIGKKTADQLEAAGITSVQEFIAADIAKLSKKTGLTLEKIEKLKEEAVKVMG